MWFLPSAWGLWCASAALLEFHDIGLLIRAGTLWGLLSSLLSAAHPAVAGLSWAIAMGTSHLVTKTLRLPPLLLMACGAYTLSASLKFLFWSATAISGMLPFHFALTLLTRELPTIAAYRALFDAASGAGALILSSILTFNLRSVLWARAR